MKKLLALSACSALLGASSFALAGNFQQPNNNFNNQNVTGGAYIGGSVGIGGMDTPKLHAGDHNDFTSTSSTLRHGVAYRADLGYLFAVTPKLLLGGEFGYMGYPNNKYTGSFDNYTENLKYQGHLFDLLGVAKYYFGSNFNIFGKAGAAYVYQKTTASITAAPVAGLSTSKNKILPELAAGIGYDFTPTIGANITYSHVFGNKPSFQQDINSLSKVASVNTLLAGLTYKFSM